MKLTKLIKNYFNIFLINNKFNKSLIIISIIFSFTTHDNIYCQKPTFLQNCSFQLIGKSSNISNFISFEKHLNTNANLLLLKPTYKHQKFIQTLTFKALVILVFLFLLFLLFKFNLKRVENQKRKLTELVKERTIHIEMQKEELKVQAENMMEVNLLLKESREELLHQKEELQTQSENLQEVNVLLYEKQEEIQAQAEELTFTNNELNKLNATKDKFFSIIAHDLKNPLFAITSFSDMLANDFEELDDNKKLEFINIIQNSSTAASSLLDKLLQWARSQSNKVQLIQSNFKADELIKEVEPLIHANLENKSIKLNYILEKDVVIFADKNMMHIVLLNIINNAIKFTKPKGEIIVASKTKDSYVEISIKDNGIGMSDENKNSIFRIDTFNTTPGTSGEKGTGLGLIICKEFVEKNDGKIEVKSKIDEGSDFIISIPKGK